VVALWSLWSLCTLCIAYAQTASAQGDDPTLGDLTPSAPSEPPTYQHDPHGHPYRVRFDLGSRALIGAAVAFTTTGDAGVVITPELQAGLHFRSFTEDGEGEERSSWRIDNRLIDVAWLWPVHRPGGMPSMSATVYRGQYLRHSAPYLIIPSSPPARIFFPFDVGVDLTAGQVWAPASTQTLNRGPEIPLLRLTTLAAYVVLDPWRSGRAGDSFEMGFGMRYDIDIEGDNLRAFDSPDIIHRIAPFTSTSLRLHLEDLPGLTALDLRAELTPHWSSENEDWRLSSSSTLHLERTLIAINDQPVALTLDASYRHHPSTDRVPTADEWRATLGLALLLGY
jgi:hypothetical protein